MNQMDAATSRDQALNSLDSEKWKDSSFRSVFYFYVSQRARRHYNWRGFTSHRNTGCRVIGMKYLPGIVFAGPAVSTSWRNKSKRSRKDIEPDRTQLKNKKKQAKSHHDKKLKTLSKEIDESNETLEVLEKYYEEVKQDAARSRTKRNTNESEMPPATSVQQRRNLVLCQ
jgi:hypothetical protein